MDFGGITVLIMGSSMPPHYYPFACQPTHTTRNILMAIITSTSVMCFILTMTPKFQVPKWRPVVTGAFIVLGLSAAMPMYFLCLFVKDFTHYTKTYTYEDIELWLAGGAVYIIGGIMYAFRIPERFFTGKLDIVGNSHQIFHVMIMIACYMHIKAGYQMYLERFDKVCPII